MIISQNVIQSCLVTVEDIAIAEKICGPDVSNLKERTAIQIPKVVVETFIEIPRKLTDNNYELILCMGIKFINQQEFFTTINKYIWSHGLVPLSYKTKKECYRGLYAVMKH